jgi:hypothetical protein
MERTAKVTVRRTTELGKREATLLENNAIRVLIDDRGGMIPELSVLSGPGTGGRINAHWNPWFRGNGSSIYDENIHGPFWKAALLYHLAGNFPCLPNFGPGQYIDGKTIPPHGWSANELWHCSQYDIDEEAAWAVSTMDMDGPQALHCTKIDAVQAGEPVHYTSLIIENTEDRPVTINVGWHNTVGAPFLEAGCRISGCAEAWQTAPEGSEFDLTGRLEIGKTFERLDTAPLRKGGTADLSLVPPPIGYTDFVTGAIPAKTQFGWSAVVNPHQHMAYICFFPGPAGVQANEIALSFNDLWMQYGGRPFTPWAAYEGGTDLTYCLGTENAVGAFANGLEYARKNPSILGNPTLVEIPARGRRILRYGTLFAPYWAEALSAGIARIEAVAEGLLCRASGNGKGEGVFVADPSFRLLQGLEKKALQ